MSESDVFVTFIFRFICLVLVLAHLHLPSRLFRFYHFIFSHFHSMLDVCNVSAFRLCVLCVCVCVHSLCASSDLLIFGLSMCAKPVLYHNNICELSVRFFPLSLSLGWLEQSEKLTVFCVLPLPYSEIVNYEGIISAKTKTKTKTTSTEPTKKRNCNRIFCVMFGMYLAEWHIS